MDLVSGSIIGLWGLSVPIRITAAGRIASERLVGRYPFLSAWLFGSAVHSAWLIYVEQTGGKAAYGSALAASLTISLAAECILALEGFWVIVRDFRHVAPAAAVSAFAFAAIGLLAIAGSFDMGAPEWSYVRSAYLLVRRHFAIACLVFTASARLCWGKGLGPVSRNAAVYSNALLLYFSGEVAGHAIMRASLGAYWIVAVGQYALQAGTIGGYLCWAGLRHAGEGMTIDDSVPDDGVHKLASIRRDLHAVLKDMFG